MPKILQTRAQRDLLPKDNDDLGCGAGRSDRSASDSAKFSPPFMATQVSCGRGKVVS